MQAMTLPIWVPWVLALCLAWPVIVRLGVPEDARKSTLAIMLVPGLAMALFAVTLSLGSTGGQDELDAAASKAARQASGNYGPVTSDRLVQLMADEVEGDLDAEVSELTTDGANVSYTIELATGSDEAVCFDVMLEPMSSQAPDVRFATVKSRSGNC